MEWSASRYTFRKNGIFYLQRYIPADLRRHYRTDRIQHSLRTRSPREAQVLAMQAVAKLEAYWFSLRAADGAIPGQHLLAAVNEAPAPVEPRQPDQPRLSFRDAAAIYLRLKGNGRGKTFAAGAMRAVDYVEASIGKKALVDLHRKDAGKFRDFLVAKGLASSSVVRVLTTVKAILNFAIQEEGLEMSNPFSGVFVDRSQPSKQRVPVPAAKLAQVRRQCRYQDDDLRWIVAAVADTGCRLSEIVGLHREDVVVDAEHPYLIIRPHPWRRLKTTASERKVPLIGSALWSMHRCLERQQGPFLFPRYTNANQTNGNSASAALSKWLKGVVGEEFTVHSFRHSLRDRLRAVECPVDIADQIGGWARSGIGEGYGQGYDLAVLAKWMQAIDQQR